MKDYWMLFGWTLVQTQPQQHDDDIETVEDVIERLDDLFDLIEDVLGKDNDVFVHEIPDATEEKEPERDATDAYDRAMKGL